MKNIYEVFDEFAKANTKQERIDVLRNNKSYALVSVLQGTFDPNVEFIIERVPLYKPEQCPPGMGFTSLHKEINRAYLFQKNHPKADKNLTDKRREQLLIQILEALEEREAQVFMNMILKKQKVPGLNAKIVQEAFPNLF
jgi:hypothetical protein